MAADDGQISLEKGVRSVPNEGEHRFAIVAVIGQVVEERPANAAGFSAMVIVKISVALRLELLVVGDLLVAVTCALVRRVKVVCVVLVEVVGGEVGSPAEPAGFATRQPPVIHVDGRNVGASRVKHQRDACGCKQSPSANRKSSCELVAELTIDEGEADASPLEHGAILEDSCAAFSPEYGATVAAMRSFPRIDAKLAGAVERCDLRADLRLERSELRRTSLEERFIRKC